MGIRNLMTVNFEKCENDMIDLNTFQQLECEGVRLLRSVVG